MRHGEDRGQEDGDGGRIVDEGGDRSDGAHHGNQRASSTPLAQPAEHFADPGNGSGSLQPRREDKHRRHGDRGRVAEARESLLRCDDAGHQQGAEDDHGDQIRPEPVADEEHHGDNHEAEHDSGGSSH